VIVAGGKYTTHRKMAEEIVDFTLRMWSQVLGKNSVPPYPLRVREPNTKNPVNPAATSLAVAKCQAEIKEKQIELPQELFERFGAEALDLWERYGPLSMEKVSKLPEPEGFPLLEAQLRHTIRTEMVMSLEDFYLRRVPLYASRKDHGLPWAEALARVWAEERGLNNQEAEKELERLKIELEKRSSWIDPLV
jgi:glycerol-3-phosphate dehydrogenase